MPHTRHTIDLVDADVAQLVEARYDGRYSTSISVSQEPLLWRSLISDKYNKFSDEVETVQVLELAKNESLYHVCATNEDLPYTLDEDIYYRATTLTREMFCQKFIENQNLTLSAQKEVNYFVALFLRNDFRRPDINARFHATRHPGGVGLPPDFPQMLWKLCIDTYCLVDFMEASVRTPFTSDLDHLLRNFCYHVSVKGIARPDLWTKHAASIYDTYQILFNELDGPPHKYHVIKAFLRTRRFDDKRYQVLNTYMISTAMVKFILDEASDRHTARTFFQCAKEAVVEVENFERAVLNSNSEYSPEMTAVCDKLMEGIQFALQMQCLWNAQIKILIRIRGGNLATSSFILYRDLALEGINILRLEDSGETIKNWIAQANMKHLNERTQLAFR